MGNVGKTNKNKGNNAERHYAMLFRELGFTFCETSRFASKKHDNAKIDLIEVPFNIQIKAGKQTGMNPGKELLLMENSIKTMFSPEDPVHKKPLLLFHYMEVGRGKKRLPEHEFVYMSNEQFDLFRKRSKKLEYSTLKTFNFEMFSQFKTIVGMPFEVFRNEVILRQYKIKQPNVTSS